MTSPNFGWISRIIYQMVAVQKELQILKQLILMNKVQGQIIL